MPGWEQFLTQQDKEHLEIWGKRESLGLGKAPCVLVIDDYYRALGLERKPILESMQKWPQSCGLEGWEAIDKTAELLQAARANNVPVIYTHSLEGFPSPVGMAKFSNRKLVSLTQEELSKANEIVEEIAPQPGDLVIKKTNASPFWVRPCSSTLTTRYRHDHCLRRDN